MADLYWRDETHHEYGVLVAYGYGSGWSSWNSPRLAYDRKVIEYWMTHKDKNVNFQDIGDALTKMGYPNTYVAYSNWLNLKLEWVPVNIYWRIREYDGAETIERLNLAVWNRFDTNGDSL